MFYVPMWERCQVHRNTASTAAVVFTLSFPFVFLPVFNEFVSFLVCIVK